MRTELSLLYIYVILNLLCIFILLDALNHFLPVYVKGSRKLKLSQRESTFYVNRSRVLIFNVQIAKTKLK